MTMGRQSHKNMPYMCGACKKGFGSEKAVKAHAVDAHPNAENIGIYRCVSHVTGKDWEPSMGDLMAEALMHQAMGEPVENEWLLP